MKFQTYKITDLDLIIDIIDPHQDEYHNMGVGIRGLNKDEVGKQYLRQSRVWDDGEVTDEGLCGTSAIEVVHNWYCAGRDEVGTGLAVAAELVKNYGNAKLYALVVGDSVGGAEDIGEIVLSARDNPVGGAEVIAYIDISK